MHYDLGVPAGIPAAMICLTVLWLAPAAAHAGGGVVSQAPTVSELEPGPVKRLLLDLQKRLREGKHAPALIQAPVQEALRASDRARSARAAGDGRHAPMLDKLAEQWASAAEAVLRAVETEKKAAAEAQRLAELTTKVERAEALLAEHQARLGRLQAEVKKAEQGIDDAGARAAEREKKRIEAAGGKKGSR